jgi:hypothetical protein
VKGEVCFFLASLRLSLLSAATSGVPTKAECHSDLRNEGEESSGYAHQQRSFVFLARQLMQPFPNHATSAHPRPFQFRGQRHEELSSPFSS